MGIVIVPIWAATQQLTDCTHTHTTDAPQYGQKEGGRKAPKANFSTMQLQAKQKFYTEQLNNTSK